MASESAHQGLLRRLEELRGQYEHIAAEMNQPEVAANPTRITALAREHGKLRAICEPYEKYRRSMATVEENRGLLNDPSADEDLKDLAREEIESARAAADDLFESMKKALVTGEDAAIDSIILEIRAGTGGDEAALFARDLYSMYQRYCDKHKFKIEVMDSSMSEIGGVREIVLNVKGAGVYQHLGYEGGGHRVQRVPETESQGRVHTSAATVAVLPEAQEIDVKIDWEKDVVEHVSRAGGPGGQNVNKVSSAIRLEHLPSGITVSMRDDKSQHKNRAKARRILITRVHEAEQSVQQSERDASRKTMIGSGDRSQRIRTYNFPQNRCTDHRIGMDLYSLDRLILGDMEELIEALQKHDLEQRLQNL